MDLFFKTASLIISLAGFIIIILQLTNLDKNLKSSARGSIYDMSSRIKEVFLTKPHLRKYFFEGVDISSNDPLYDEVMAVADYYCLYLEQITTQKDNIAKEERSSWLRYAHDIYHQSPVIQQYLKDKKNWYSSRFWRVVENDS